MPQIAFQSSDARRVSRLGRDSFGSLADHFNVPYDGILQLF
jgi:hypothetical protein